MTPTEDKQINTSLPFLQDGMVLYVGRPDSSLCSYLRKDLFEYQLIFNNSGYSLVLLPDLLSEISQEMLHYMFPGQQIDVSCDSICGRIQNLAGLDGKTGFLYKRDGLTLFREIPDGSVGVIEAAVDLFIKGFAPDLYDTEIDEEEDAISYSRPAPYSRPIQSTDHCREPFDFDECEIVQTRKSEISFSKKGEDLPLDRRTQAIIDAWEKLESEYGVTIEEIEVLLDYRVKLSRINITTAGQILLTDYNNREVKMDDLTKAVYFFYLKHPEGAKLKELHEYEPEIRSIYMSITGRDNVQEIRKSINNLLDPYGNNLNVSMSRIKKAFKDVVGDRIAQHYYIDGRYGEVRTVRLDRDLVIWNR